MNSGAEGHYILAQSHIPASPGLAPGLAHKGQRKEESAKDQAPRGITGPNQSTKDTEKH